MDDEAEPCALNEPAERKPVINLDYASPDAQLSAEEQVERERKAALDNYNESTFGEPAPFGFASIAARFIVMGVVMIVMAMVLPQATGSIVAALIMIVYVAWERNRERDV
jgi:hypothetical protein